MLCGVEFQSASWWFLIVTFRTTAFNVSLPWKHSGDRDAWLGERIGASDRRAIQRVWAEQVFRRHDAGWRWLIEDVLRHVPPYDWSTTAPPCHQKGVWKRVVTQATQNALSIAVRTYLDGMLENANNTSIGDIPRTDTEMGSYSYFSKYMSSSTQLETRMEIIWRQCIRNWETLVIDFNGPKAVQYWQKIISNQSCNCRCPHMTRTYMAVVALIWWQVC